MRREAKRLKAAAAEAAEDAAVAAYDAAGAATIAAAKLKEEGREGGRGSKERRFQAMGQRLKRAKYYCSCKCPIHTEKCRIRHWSGAVLWWGWPDVGREDLK